MTAKTTLKLKQTVTQRLHTNAVNTTYIPSGSIQDYNNSVWNDTESNITISNDTALLPFMKLPTERKDDLIFGFFKLYALILLAIFVILILAITAVACYFDCENRRSYLPGARYSAITRGAVSMVPVKYADKQPDIMPEKEIQKDVTPESLMHSRTLRKRKMLIDAQRSASSQSDTTRQIHGRIKAKLSDMPDAKLEQIDITTKDVKIYAIPRVAEMKSGESVTGRTTSSVHEASLSSSALNSKNEKQSMTAYNDMEEDEGR